MDILGKALADKLSSDCLKGKGGYWIKGKGFYTIAQARRITEIKATPRPPRQEIMPYGDYATIAMINGVKI